MNASVRWLIAISACTAAPAQYVPAQSLNNYRVEIFTTDDGLPSQSISDIAETSDGFLWIATGGIIARFDGYQFRTYTQANTPALVRRAIHLHAGLGDTLWIVDEGNAVLALAGGKVVEVVPPSSRELGAVVQDGLGNLFGAGYTSIWRLHRGSVDRQVVLGAPHSLGGEIRLVRDAGGRAWVVDSMRILREIGAPPSPASSVPTQLTSSLLVSRATGEVLSLRTRGSARDAVRGDGTVVASFTGSADEGAFFLDGDRRLWTVGKRTYDVREPGRAEPVARIPQIEAGTTGTMTEGTSGCVWITELVLLKVCRVPFYTIPLTVAGRLYVARGPAGTALSADARGRVVAVDAAGTEVPIAPAHDDLLSARAFIDRRGTTWWSMNTPRMKSGSNDGPPGIRMLPHRYVIAIAQSPRDDDHLWYAAGQRLYRAWLPPTGNAVVTDSVAADGLVTAMDFASDGTLWVTVKRVDLQSQVLAIASGTVRTLSLGDGLPSAALRAVHADDDGTVWLGTYGGGLVRFRNGAFHTVTELDGLGEDVVTSLLDDGAGNFWMGGNRSVHRVSRRDLADFLDGRIRRVHGVTYGRADGITSPETSGYPGFRDNTGRLWFPTIGGIAVVDPMLALALDTAPPRIHLLDIRTEHDTVANVAANVQLTRGARRVTVRYTGISNRKSDAVRYEYRIDGLDADWVDAGHAREATYNGVVPGTHVFRVRAVNAGGVRSARDATLEFSVPPFFHETPASYIVLLAALGALALFVLRYRERELRHREALLTTAVEERTAKLTSTLDVVARQADQLRTLDEAKSRFFANVSHEFRTPLSLIIGPVEDLRDGRSGVVPVAVRRRLDAVHGNARRLLQLVEQLLDVARLESGTLHLSADVRDLVPLLRRLAESFASLAERRGIEFSVTLPVGGLRVRHDPDQMEKVINNLVGNALKFTARGGEVSLRAAIDADDGEGTAVIEVQDSGPGIAPEFHARVFERFFQVDDSSRRAHEGTGIGLALVRELVTLHGGTVTLRSALGEGSTFTVRLPIGAGPPRSSAEHQNPTSPPEAEAITVANAAPSAPHRPSPTGDRTTVLVVEDNAELLEFLREHLADRFRVLMASNGVRGLEMAREHVPDLVISDVMMPEMDGQALCEAIKHDADIDFIPVILLTAKASRDSRLAGLVGGADDYLAKPVDLRELMIRADNLIASRRRVRERYDALNRQLPSVSVPVLAPPRDATERALLDTWKQVLAAHLGDEDFDIEAMAAAMGLGRSTLYRKLAPLLGHSPMDALWEYRLAQGAQWLSETSITMSEVAYGVGFKSVPHFCSRFRERYRETPSEYRRARTAGA